MKKKYRVGVIGSTGKGNYGHDLDTAWLQVPEAEVIAVADDDDAGRAKAVKRLGVDQSFADYRAMLEQVKPDIVVICQSWLDRHHEMAMAAAERGMHIYIEKPFCRTLEEADDLVTTCERTHSRLAMALPTRYSPKLQTIRKLLKGNKIGRVLEYRGRGKEDRRGGGEDLWVLGIHVMDMIRSLGGHPEWCFAEVTQNGRPVTQSDVVEGNAGIGPLAGDQVRAMYGLPGGATAYFASTRNVAARPTRYGLQIFGSHGIIELMEGVMPSVKYLKDRSWSPGRSNAQWQDVSSKGIDQPEPLKGNQYGERHLLAIQDLLSAIEGRRQPLCNMYEARGATEMIAAVFESHRQKQPVKLPLENRKNPLTMLN